MKILFYITKDFERSYILAQKASGLTIRLTEEPLSLQTAIMARGSDCISIFTNDDDSSKVLEQLHAVGVMHIAIRAAREALTNIAETTFYNINCWANNKKSENELKPELIQALN